MIRKVAVIMGSDSDWPVVKGACTQLKDLGIPFEAHILSAHRTPAEAAAFAKGAKEAGFGVILCAAGMAAHLAGAFAANTTLPVIGIPMKGGAMDGLDALLATVQMPSRRLAGRPDPGPVRRGAGRPPGRGAGQDGPRHRRQGGKAAAGGRRAVTGRTACTIRKEKRQRSTYV